VDFTAIGADEAGFHVAASAHRLDLGNGGGGASVVAGGGEVAEAGGEERGAGALEQFAEREVGVEDFSRRVDEEHRGFRAMEDGFPGGRMLRIGGIAHIVDALIVSSGLASPVFRKISCKKHWNW